MTTTMPIAYRTEMAASGIRFENKGEKRGCAFGTPVLTVRGQEPEDARESSDHLNTEVLDTGNDCTIGTNMESSI